MSEPSASAIRIAVKALARRELSAAELTARLERAGVTRDEADETVAHLQAAGYQSDRRAALERGRVLAGRSLGDAAIQADLGRRGLGTDDVEAALAQIPAEADRADALLARLGSGPALERALRSKGFAAETIEHVLAATVAHSS